MNIASYTAILGVLTLIVGAGVYLYSTAKKGRIDVVRQDNIDLRASNQELRTEKAGHLATIAQQTDTIKNLREVATQTPAVSQLLEMTADQQKTINAQHGAVIKQLSDLAKELAKLTSEFSRVAKAMSKNTTAQEANTTERQK